MLNQLTVAEAQIQLPELSATLAGEPVVITQDGMPVLIAFTVENFLSFLETAEILADVEFLGCLRRGIVQADRQEFFELTAVKAELGL
jgi:antitoxin YefM